MDVVERDGHDSAPVADHHARRVDDALVTAATVGFVAASVALFEAALLPGVILGVAAMWAPKYLPRMVGSLDPLVKSGLRGAYGLARKTKAVVTDARERVQVVVAEARAEDEPNVVSSARLEPALAAVEAPGPARKSRKKAK